MFHEFQCTHLISTKCVHSQQLYTGTVLHNTFFKGNCEHWWVQKGKDDLADISVIFFLYAALYVCVNIYNLQSTYCTAVFILNLHCMVMNWNNTPWSMVHRLNCPTLSINTRMLFTFWNSTPLDKLRIKHLPNQHATVYMRNLHVLHCRVSMVRSIPH